MLPLLDPTPTRKPCIYRTFEFGGDDWLAYLSKFVPSNDIFWFSSLRSIRSRFIEADKIDNRLVCGQIETEYHELLVNLERTIMAGSESRPLNDQLLADWKIKVETDHNQVSAELKSRLEFNKQNRMRIVEAWGIHRISQVSQIWPSNLSAYMKFTIADLPPNQTMAQYEDRAGRKGLIFKVRSKIDQTEILASVSQRYRETCLVFNGGDIWITQIGDHFIIGTDESVKFIEQLVNGINDAYQLIY